MIYRGAVSPLTGMHGAFELLLRNTHMSLKPNAEQTGIIYVGQWRRTLVVIHVQFIRRLGFTGKGVVTFEWEQIRFPVKLVELTSLLFYILHSLCVLFLA